MKKNWNTPDVVEMNLEATASSADCWGWGWPSTNPWGPSKPSKPEPKKPGKPDPCPWTPCGPDEES